MWTKICRNRIRIIKSLITRITTNIGATDIISPAVLDCIIVSDQLIKKKGIKFPRNPIIIIKIIILNVGLKTNFLNLK